MYATKDKKKAAMSISGSRTAFMNTNIDKPVSKRKGSRSRSRKSKNTLGSYRLVSSTLENRTSYSPTVRGGGRGLSTSFNQELISRGKNRKVPGLNMARLNTSLVLNRSMKAPVNSVNELTRTNSRILSSKRKGRSSRSRKTDQHATDQYSSIYDNIVSTRRSRKKDEILQSEHYF